jgi:hypothetical protein
MAEANSEEPSLQGVVIAKGAALKQTDEANPRLLRYARNDTTCHCEEPSLRGAVIARSKATKQSRDCFPWLSTHPKQLSSRGSKSWPK